MSEALCEAMQRDLGLSSLLSGTQGHLESFTHSVSSPSAEPQVGIYALGGDALGSRPGACVWDKHRPHLRQLDIIPGMFFPQTEKFFTALNPLMMLSKSLEFQAGTISCN